MRDLLLQQLQLTEYELVVAAMLAGVGCHVIDHLHCYCYCYVIYW